MLAKILSRFTTLKLWVCLFGLQILSVAAIYGITQSHVVFYGLGFLILFNAFVGLYPLWAIHSHLPKKETNHHTLRLQEILNSYFPKEKNVSAELRTTTTPLHNFLILKFRNQLVISVDQQMLESLSHEEVHLVFRAIKDLHEYHILDSAMFLSAIYTALPFLHWLLGLKSATGIELCYLTAGESPDWHRLNLKILHRQRKVISTLPLATRPHQLFPMLTVDKKESYFSIYTLTRDNLLRSLPLKKDSHHV